jgi:hypothetical protein
MAAMLVAVTLLRVAPTLPAIGRPRLARSRAHPRAPRPDAALWRVGTERHHGGQSWFDFAMTRRAFLKHTSVATLGLGTGSMLLSGCRHDDTSDGEPATVDDEAATDNLAKSLATDYDAAAALERAAAALVRKLEEASGLSHATPEHVSDAELAALDQEINSALAAVYDRGAHARDAMVDSVLARVALLHWTVLIRRRAMRSFHTAVDGLIEDGYCAGDFLVDTLLLEYFDTLFAGGDTSERDAVVRLARLARQTACIGAAQSAWLASHLYWTFGELWAFLRFAGLERLLPYVAEAAANPLLLMYDVEKYRGPRAPLSRWFVEMHAVLDVGARTGRLPIAWHGLWLYDRRSGHLLGYRADPERHGENLVDLAAFLSSIILTHNLGKSDCSFTEMLERGKTDSGYFCLGSTCAGSDASDHGTNLRVDRVAGRATRAFRSRRAGAAPSNDTEECDDTTTGAGYRPAECGDGLTVAGRVRSSPEVVCITQELFRANPGARVLRCLLEATGRCADPLESAAKELFEVLLPGIPLGRNCALSDDEEGDTGGGTEPDYETEKARIDAEYDDRVAAADEALKSATDDLARAQQEELHVKNDPNSTEQDIADAVSATDQAAEAVNLTAELTYELKQQAWEDRRSQLNELDRRSANRLCPEDTPSCGGNNCTGMTDAARKTQECSEILIDASTTEGQIALNPFGPRQPGVIDPSPLDDVNDPTWNPCMQVVANSADPAASRCWAVDCGYAFLTTRDEVDNCNCQATKPDGGLRAHCYEVDCPEGEPVFRDGSCRCTTDSEASGTGGPIVLGDPPRFWDLRGAELEL